MFELGGGGGNGGGGNGGVCSSSKPPPPTVDEEDEDEDEEEDEEEDGGPGGPGLPRGGGGRPLIFDYLSGMGYIVDNDCWSYLILSYLILLDWKGSKGMAVVRGGVEHGPTYTKST